mmetsp:Transcript_25565/g.52432  ORF Transcript_25565/g.52432 Transcript_25565/m.52432 type:complete len:142 (-) Transcript_25565:651-1076(-)
MKLCWNKLETLSLEQMKNRSCNNDNFTSTILLLRVAHFLLVTKRKMMWIVSVDLCKAYNQSEINVRQNIENLKLNFNNNDLSFKKSMVKKVNSFSCSGRTPKRTTPSLCLLKQDLVSAAAAIPNFSDSSNISIRIKHLNFT